MPHHPDHDVWIEALYREHSDLIFRVAASRLRQSTGSDADAEDILQEVFLTACGRLPIDHPNPVGWLIKATDNMCLNHAAANKRHKKRLQRQMEAILASRGPYRYDSASPDRTGDVDLQITLESALTQMDLQLYRAFYINGYSLREISQMTGKSSGSLRVQLFRLRKRIERLLPIVVISMILLRFAWPHR